MSNGIGGSENGGGSEKLHIFVNRKKFDEDGGVKSEMSGAQIAGLVGIAPEQARVFLETGPGEREIGMNEVVQIKNGLHFVASRKVVEGGSGV
jgi:hypothetical protein